MTLLILTTQLCYSQDTLPYFNKTLPKNGFTGTIFGETVFFSVGYERCFYSKKKIRISFSTKIGISPSCGAAIPTGVLVEVFANKNKLFGGVYLGNNVNPFARRYSMKDVKEIENDPSPLKTNVCFIYAPYGAATLGYKRYFNKKHALSLYAIYGVYPGFDLYHTNSEVKAKLAAHHVALGGLTYHRQF